jgi:hypothetical protein
MGQGLTCSIFLFPVSEALISFDMTGYPDFPHGRAKPDYFLCCS